MPATTIRMPVTGTIAACSDGVMLILSRRLDGHDTFLTGQLELGDAVMPVRILTLDDVTLLRLPHGATPPALRNGRWSATLHLPHGQRPRTVPADLAAAACAGLRDITALDHAELRYTVTFLDEATTHTIRQARVHAIVSALPEAPVRR